MSQASHTKSFISAKILGARVVTENSDSKVKILETGSLAIAEKGLIEIAWSPSDEGNFSDVFSITSEMECTLYSDGEERIKYTCKYEVRFGVNEFIGFDPSKHIPEVAMSPYVDVTLFLTRAHATRAIQSLGAHRFAFHNPIDAMGIVDKAAPKSRMVEASPRATKKKAVGKAKPPATDGN